MDWKQLFYKKIVVPAQGGLAFIIWQLLAHRDSVEKAFFDALEYLPIFWIVLNVCYLISWQRTKNKQ